MKIYQLTAIGKQIAASPSTNQSTGLRILAFLRRHGYQATGEQIRAFTGASISDLNAIEKSSAVRVIPG